MSQAERIIKWIGRWIGMPASIIGTVFTVLSFFHSPVVVTDAQGLISCNGFLIYDPPSDILVSRAINKKERDYLNNKLNCYRDQLQNKSQDAAAYTNIGEVERRLGNLETARKAHQKALELQSKLPEAKIGLALVEQDMKHEEAAMQNIKTALLQNANGLTYLYQGVILHKQNDFKGAKIAWQKAKELTPSNLWVKKLPKLGVHPHLLSTGINKIESLKIFRKSK